MNRLFDCGHTRSCQPWTDSRKIKSTGLCPSCRLRSNKLFNVADKVKTIKIGLKYVAVYKRR